MLKTKREQTMTLTCVESQGECNQAIIIPLKKHNKNNGGRKNYDFDSVQCLLSAKHLSSLFKLRYPVSCFHIA